MRKPLRYTKRFFCSVSFCREGVKTKRKIVYKSILPVLSSSRHFQIETILVFIEMTFVFFYLSGVNTAAFIMNNKEILQGFIQNSISAPLNVVEEIAEQFDEICIPKNDFFLKTGTYTNHYMFLCKGFLRAYSFDQDGNEVITGFYKDRSVVFEVYSFFNRTVSTENIQALADSEGLVITYEKLNHLFHSLPAFRDFGRAMLVKGFTALKYRTLSMINETAEERYNNLIRSNPEVFQYAPLKDIASYLGITDTSLSRIRKHITQK